MIRKALICFIYFISLVVGHQTQAQEADASKELAQKLLETGDEIYYQQKAPEAAKEKYIAAAQADHDNIRANYMAGKLITETINKQEATPFFLKVYALDQNYRFDILYSIGRAYQYGLDFEKAIEYYNLYINKLNKEKDYSGDDKVPLNQVKRRIFESENGLEYVQNARDFSIVNMGSAINSNSLDYAPIVNADETMMIFTSRRREGNVNEKVYDDNFAYEDIFISHKVNGQWSPAENIGGTVNSLYFESNLALSADGQHLYIYRDRNNGDIYVSDRESDGSWLPPQPLNSNINSNYSENSVSIAPDGQTLYFSSNRRGGHGGFDLYKCEKGRKGDWGKATNLGDEINTPFDEDAVFIDYDGKTLYFSSRGHKGMGEFDIYKSVYDQETKKWSQPVNLGYPINTPDDDIFFVSTKEGTRGYYATVRNGGLGYLDIYMVEKPDVIANQNHNPEKEQLNKLAKKDSTNQNKGHAPNTTALLQPIQLLLKVEDNQTGSSINAKVTLKSTSDGSIQVPKKVAQGIYQFNLTHHQPGNYLLSVESTGYMFKNVNVEIPAATIEAQEFRKKMGLDKVTAGSRMQKILEFIYFDFNSARLKPESNEELERLKTFLESNPETNIEIAGHTDNWGSRAYNKSLSQKRAQAIVDYLIQHGIGASRLTAKGYGEEQPLATNDDEMEGRILNRRVELRVLGKNQQASK